MDDFKLLPGNTDPKYSINKRNKRRFIEKEEKRIRKNYKFRIAVISMIVVVFIISVILICSLRFEKAGKENIKKYKSRNEIKTEN